MGNRRGDTDRQEFDPVSFCSFWSAAFVAPDNRSLQRDIEVSIMDCPFQLSEGISWDHLPIDLLQARPAFSAKGSLGFSNCWDPSGPPLSGSTFSKTLLRSRCFWFHLRHSQKAQAHLPTTLVEERIQHCPWEILKPPDKVQAMALK